MRPTAVLFSTPPVAEAAVSADPTPAVMPALNADCPTARQLNLSTLPVAMPTTWLAIEPTAAPIAALATVAAATAAAPIAVDAARPPVNAAAPVAIVAAKLAPAVTVPAAAPAAVA